MLHNSEENQQDEELNKKPVEMIEPGTGGGASKNQAATAAAVGT